MPPTLPPATGNWPAAGRSAKGHLLRSERCPFTRQKTAFRNAKGRLLENRRRPNLAMQMWMKNFNIALSLAPRYYKKRNKVETGLGVMFNYVQPVYRFIGVTGGIGLSMSLEGSEENTPTRFEWNLGIVFRFFKD